LRALGRSTTPKTRANFIDTGVSTTAAAAAPANVYVYRPIFLPNQKQTETIHAGRQRKQKFPLTTVLGSHLPTKLKNKHSAGQYRPPPPNRLIKTFYTTLAAAKKLRGGNQS
jgi:hypothetical protein